MIRARAKSLVTTRRTTVGVFGVHIRPTTPLRNPFRQTAEVDERMTPVAQVTVELKNDLAITGMLHSVDQVRHLKAIARLLHRGLRWIAAVCFRFLWSEQSR